MLRTFTAVLVTVLVAAPAVAQARRAGRHAGAGHGTSFTVRIGSGTLDLRAGEGTPVIGGWLNDAVDAYNGAAGAYNAAHGMTFSTPGAAPARGYEAVDLRTDLTLVTPSLESGGHGYFFKLEAPLGFADGWNTYGIGLYPVNAAFGLGSDNLEGFLSAGVVGSYITDGADARGLLLQGRVAAGVRVRSGDGWGLSAELGYGLFGFGGALDGNRMRELQAYDPRAMAPPPGPGEVARGGDQQGMIDVAVGVTLP